MKHTIHITIGTDAYRVKIRSKTGRWLFKHLFTLDVVHASKLGPCAVIRLREEKAQPTCYNKHQCPIVAFPTLTTPQSTTVCTSLGQGISVYIVGGRQHSGRRRWYSRSAPVLLRQFVPGALFIFQGSFFPCHVYLLANSSSNLQLTTHFLVLYTDGCERSLCVFGVLILQCRYYSSSSLYSTGFMGHARLQRPLK